MLFNSISRGKQEEANSFVADNSTHSLFLPLCLERGKIFWNGRKQAVKATTRSKKKGGKGGCFLLSVIENSSLRVLRGVSTVVGIDVSPISPDVCLRSVVTSQPDQNSDQKETIEGNLLLQTTTGCNRKHSTTKNTTTHSHCPDGSKHGRGQQCFG